MKVAQISKPGGNFELVERDVMVKDGVWPGLQYPRVPGHEIAGLVACRSENITTDLLRNCSSDGQAARFG
jgi:hypothetical protein